MCVAGEEEPGGSTTTGGSTSTIEEIVVTAPRLGLDLDVFGMIDWSEVAALTTIGAVGGSYNGWPGIVITGATAAAAAVESQTGVDLTDLFEIKNDMIVIPGLYPMY